MTFLQRLRILPLLVLVASLALVVRVGEVAIGFEQSGIAFAQQEVDQEPPPLSGVQEEDEDHKEASEGEGHDAADDSHSAQNEDDTDGKQSGIPSMPATDAGEAVEWKDSSEAEFDYSAVRSGLYEDLAERRKNIEELERSIAVREALLEAAERELDQKLREMTAVRDEIKGLMQEQSDQRQQRVNSLVKIYEGMKAKDAARIFNTLDMDVLIAVMTRMSERKSAPILAEMNAERARSVTILMAQQSQLPPIPPQ